MNLRIIWLFIIIPYFGIFFFNRFAGVSNYIFPLLFSYGLVGWLGFEFYIRNSFFQSGLIPGNAYPYWLRILTAVYFYGSFILANFQIETLGGKTSLGFPGLVILFLGIYIRIKADLDYLRYQENFYEHGIYRRIKHPAYLGLLFISFSMGLCFNSLLVILITIFSGFPLFYLESHFEEIYLNKRKEGFRDYSKRIRYFGLL